jgi:hypothetical protein
VSQFLLVVVDLGFYLLDDRVVRGGCLVGVVEFDFNFGVVGLGFHGFGVVGCLFFVDITMFVHHLLRFTLLRFTLRLTLLHMLWLFQKIKILKPQTIPFGDGAIPPGACGCQSRSD